MAAITLRSFLDRFLAHQQLSDCSISFEPYHAKVTRRSKRLTATLGDVEDPSAIACMSKNRTVGELLDKLVSLSPEMQAWTSEGTKRYIPRLYDDMNNMVKPDTLLGELRSRAAAREQEGISRAKRILTKAVSDCDRFLEAWQVNSVLKDLLRERS
jgi:hypothetical protein